MRTCVMLLVLFFSACGQLTDLKYDPVVLSNEDDIKGLRQKLYATRSTKDFAFEVMQITNHRCDQFFEALDRLRTDSDFALSRIAALNTAIPPILKSADASAAAIANVAAALGFVIGAINDTKQYYLLADFKPEIYKKWQIFRALQQARVEASISDNTTTSEAKLRLYEYVRLCLPSQLKQWIHESAASARTTNVLPLSAPAGRAGEAGLLLRHPGPIVID